MSGIKELRTIKVTNSDTSVHSTSKSHNEKPLLHLIKKLITSHDTKQSTVLTNSQLYDILSKEFNLDLSSLHRLEIDIYTNVMKKFLKDWPQWDEFDKIIDKKNGIDDFRTLEKILDKEYASLKSYLHGMLQASQPLAQAAAASFGDVDPKPEPKDAEEVVLEIVCPREQINQLFHRIPQKLNNTIFNFSNKMPSRILTQTPQIPSIVNWGYVTVMVNLNFFVYKREMSLKLEHTLINRKLQVERLVQPEVTSTQIRCGASGLKKYDKENILQCIDFIENSCNNQGHPDILSAIFNMMRLDLDKMVTDKFLYSPADYKAVMNKYPYERYLSCSKPVDEADLEESKFDITLRETATPTCDFTFVRLSQPSQPVFSGSDMLILECTMCWTRFSYQSEEFMESLQVHFGEHHQTEPDWFCTYCKRKFTFIELTEARWEHNCDE